MYIPHAPCLLVTTITPLTGKLIKMAVSAMALEISQIYADEKPTFL